MLLCIALGTERPASGVVPYLPKGSSATQVRDRPLPPELKSFALQDPGDTGVGSCLFSAPGLPLTIHYGCSLNTFSNIGAIRTTGPFQKTEVGSSLQCACDA